MKNGVLLLTVSLMLGYLSYAQPVSWNNEALKSKIAPDRVVKNYGDLIVSFNKSDSKENEIIPVQKLQNLLKSVRNSDPEYEFKSALLDYALIQYPYIGVENIIQRLRSIVNSNASSFIRGNAQLLLAKAYWQYFGILNFSGDQIASEFQSVYDQFKDVPIHPFTDSYFNFTINGYTSMGEIALKEIGEGYFYNGLIEKAINSYKYCLSVYPNHPEADYISFESANIAEDAIALNKFVHDFPNSIYTVFGYQALGDVLIRSNGENEILKLGNELSKKYSADNYVKESSMNPEGSFGCNSFFVTWTKKEILISIMKDDNSKATSEQIKLSFEAIGQWQRSFDLFGIKLRIDTTLINNSDISIRFGKVNSPKPGALGICWLNAGANNRQTSRITNANIYCLADLNYIDLKKVVIHELGHAFGLVHSFDNRDIMHFSTGFVSHDSISVRDRNTIKIMYSSAWVEEASWPRLTDNIEEQTVNLTAKIDKFIPISKKDSVYFKLKDTNGISSQKMYDDGSHGDVQPNDNIYSSTISFSKSNFSHPILHSTFPVGIYIKDSLNNLIFTASDIGIKRPLYVLGDFANKQITVDSTFIYKMSLVVSGYQESVNYNFEVPSWISNIIETDGKLSGTVISQNEIDTLQFTFTGIPKDKDIGNSSISLIINVNKAGEIRQVIPISISSKQFPSKITTLNTNNLKYSIFPNPNQGTFTFRINSDMSERIILKLTNSLGQVIETREIDTPCSNHSELFNISKLSKGIYYLVVSSDKQQISEKILVQ